MLPLPRFRPAPSGLSCGATPALPFQVGRGLLFRRSERKTALCHLTQVSWRITRRSTRIPRKRLIDGDIAEHLCGGRTITRLFSQAPFAQGQGLGRLASTMELLE